MRAAIPKLIDAAARLALILHCAAMAAGTHEGDAHLLDETSMRAGIRLAGWFTDEARRVYTMMSEDDQQAGVRRLLGRVRGEGGRITPRRLMQIDKRYRDADDARGAMQELVDLGYARWNTLKAGNGRDVVEVVLIDPPDPPESVEA